MRKILILISLVLIAFYFLIPAPLKHFPKSCAFCDPAILNAQKFYEDELVIALCTHKPITPGHCLVIPKRHVERFDGLTDAEITQMGRVIKKVNQAVTQVFDTSAYLLLQKNGLEAGQSVPHVHFHYIPKKAGETSTIAFMLKMVIADAKSPLSPEKMAITREQLNQIVNKDNFNN